MRYQPDHKDTLDRMFLDLPGVTPGQMFGHPSYKMHGKIFASLVEQGVIIKLPEDRVNALIAEHDHMVPFAPMGSIMRQWVQIIVPDAADYAGYQPLFEAAVEFVLSEAGK